MAKDPVCGMEVDEKKAAAFSSYEEQTYYFCARAARQPLTRNRTNILVAKRAALIKRVSSKALRN